MVHIICYSLILISLATISFCDGSEKAFGYTQKIGALLGDIKETRYSRTTEEEITLTAHNKKVEESILFVTHQGSSYNLLYLEEEQRGVAHISCIAYNKKGEHEYQELITPEEFKLGKSMFAILRKNFKPALEEPIETKQEVPVTSKKSFWSWVSKGSKK